MSYSGFKGHVFKSYEYALGTQKISTYKQTVSAVLVNYTDGNALQYDNIDLKYQDISSNSAIKLTPTDLVLSNTDIVSMNDKTGLSSTKSMEYLINIPCSSKIFSSAESDSWIREDVDWSPDPDESTLEYFKDEYGFNADYQKQEYQGYNVEEDILDENVISVTAQDFLITSAIGNPRSMSKSCCGLLLLYTDDTYSGSNAIPMVYYNFPKTFYSNHNELNVDWHADGLIKVE